MAGLSALSLSAQVVRFNLGGGFTTPRNQTGDRVNEPGWNGTAGIGLHAPVLGVRAEYQYNHFGINAPTLSSLGYPDGTMRIHSVTLNPQIELPWFGPVRAYAIGGGGYYRRTVEFTAPTTATFLGFDPFFNVFYPVAVPANQVLSSFTQQKGGINGGFGFTLGGDRVKFYAEARYHHIYTRPQPTTMIPVTFGIQF